MYAHAHITKLKKKELSTSCYPRFLSDQQRSGYITVLQVEQNERKKRNECIYTNSHSLSEVERLK